MMIMIPNDKYVSCLVCILTTLETGPYTVIQTSLHTLGFDVCFLKRMQDFVCNFLVPDIGIFLFIIVIREAVETII